MLLVIAEQREGRLNRATWEAVAAAQQAGGPVKIALAGGGIDTAASELAAADVAEVIAVDAAALTDYTADGYVMALAALIEAEKPDLVFLPHTYQTRDFAPAQRMLGVHLPDKGKKTQMISGSPAEAARDLVKRLREDARVI